MAACGKPDTSEPPCAGAGSANNKKASPKAKAKAKAQAVHGSCIPLQTQKTTETYQADKIPQDITKKCMDSMGDSVGFLDIFLYI